ncbi:MAG: cobalamin-dependent protein, partial [Sedimenticola sp.]
VHVIAATVGEDEHSVGLHEILDIKHGGIEKYGFICHDMGTSVPVEEVLEEADRQAASAVLVSTVVTHGDIHKTHMRNLDRMARERGVRDRLLLVSGGAHVSDELARECGMDAGFGRGTRGWDVASFLVEALKERGV